MLPYIVNELTKSQMDQINNMRSFEAQRSDYGLNPPSTN